MKEKSPKKQRRERHLSLIAAIAMALPYAASAQGINEQRDAIEQNRARERERALRQQQEKVPDERRPAAPPAPAARLQSETPCAVIHQVGLKVITGDPSPVSDWDWVLRSLDGPDHDDSPLRRCIGAGGIDLLVKRAQDAVLARGYITTKILLQPQETTQALTLTVIPGRIHAIRFAEPVSPRTTAWNAVPARPSDILKRHDIDQALENFKRVPNTEVEIQIAAAEAAEGAGLPPGRSDLVISYQQPRPFRLSLSADDSGTKATGKYQGSVTFSYDNWWTLNDLFYATVRGLASATPSGDVH